MLALAGVFDVRGGQAAKGSRASSDRQPSILNSRAASAAARITWRAIPQWCRVVDSTPKS